MNKPNTLPESRVLFSRLLRHGRLRQLQLLVTLQHSGSLMKAAQRLDMSQSAATQALAELERVLDLRLIQMQHGTAAAIVYGAGVIMQPQPHRRPLAGHMLGGTAQRRGIADQQQIALVQIDTALQALRW